MEKGIPLKVVIAPDKFKGSLSATDVCRAVKRGIPRSLHAQVESIPMADGGEGSLDVLNIGKKIKTIVHDPLFRKIRADYRYDPLTQTAYIEMARASGLALLKLKERNCKKTTTWGTGELISHALHHRPKHICLFLGGSATNDAGIGMAGALGYTFVDKNGNTLPQHSLTGENLKYISGILPPDSLLTIKSIRQTKFLIISDVKNSLFGKRGAAYVFASQKGANLKEIDYLDRGLRNIGQLYGDISLLAGSGSAGGLGAGAMFYLKAKIVSGVGFFIKETGLARKVKCADLIISGEGLLDRQTLDGKVISGLANLKRRSKSPFIIICGESNLTPKQIQNQGITQVYSLTEKFGKKRALKEAPILITSIMHEIIKDYL